MSLHDDWQQYEDGRVPIDATEEHVRAVKRAFYAGAQAAALQVRSGAPIDRLLTEVSEFGRTVGTRLEVAR